MSRGSSVGIETGYRPGFDSRQGLDSFFFSRASRLAVGSTQSAIQRVTVALSAGVNAGFEIDCSDLGPCGAKPLLPHTPLHGIVFNKAQR
jgi:hypothetical protein